MVAVQVKLRSENREKVTWVDMRSDLRVGSKLKLRGATTWWEVVEMYGTMSMGALLEKNKMDESFGASIKGKN